MPPTGDRKLLRSYRTNLWHLCLGHNQNDKRPYVVVISQRNGKGSTSGFA